MPAPETLYPAGSGASSFAARPTAAFMLSHPAHVFALGFGSGLSRIAPGTSGTLWAWLTFWCLTPWMGDALWCSTQAPE